LFGAIALSKFKLEYPCISTIQLPCLATHEHTEHSQVRPRNSLLFYFHMLKAKYKKSFVGNDFWFFMCALILYAKRVWLCECILNAF
jgi:hypothetical protein